jgi:hypothetical protein
VVCCGLGLVGCSHSATHTADSTSALATTPTTTTPPTSASTPTATAVPTATTPLLTGAAVRPGEAPPTIDTYVNHDNSSGALAFAAYFYKALDWSIATTNPDLLRPISAQSCTACNSYIQGLDALASAGGYSEGGRIQATSFEITEGNVVKADYVVEVTIHQRVEVIVSPGGPPSTYPPKADPLTTYIYMDWRGAGWQVVDLTQP